LRRPASPAPLGKAFFCSYQRLPPMDQFQTPETNRLIAEPENPMTSTQDLEQRVSQLQAKLKTGSDTTQLQAVQELADCGSDRALQVLMEFLQEHSLSGDASPHFLWGRVYEVLLAASSSTVATFLQTHFPQGVVPLQSERGIDYQPLQRLLAQQEFQAADQLTLQKLCELAGPTAVQRKWLYFTEVDRLASTDLQTMNQLWWVHSEGKFGFSVQRQLWLGVGKNWEALWPKIGWKSGNTWTRYPQEFTWNLTAPKGHLPLSNQLRGVQVLNALLSHPAWNPTLD
jgi:hypothetical protein